MPVFPATIIRSNQTESNNNRHKAFEFVFNHCAEMVAYCDTDLRYRFVNQIYADIFGQDNSEFEGKLIASYFTEESFQKNYNYLERVLHGEEVRYQTTIYHKKKTSGRFEVHYVPEFGIENQVTGFYAFISNIEEALNVLEARDLLHYAVDQGMEGLSIHDKNGVFVYANSAEADIYGYEVDELLGQTYAILYGEEELERINSEYFPILMANGKWRGTLNARKKDGSHFFAEVSLTTLVDESGVFDGLICTCRDITESKKSLEQLSYLAHYDHLTGLANRHLFTEKLKILTERSDRNQDKVAVISLGLDAFKHTNDTLGHTAGDELIRIIADRLKLIFRIEDIVARFSGDEFAIAVGGVNGKTDVVTLAEKITAEFDQPVNLKEQQVVQKCSVGITLYPDDGKDIGTLMKTADTAMCRAKSDGLHAYCFYSREMGEEAANYLRLTSELHQAVENNEFELHYQPIVNLHDNSISSFEALVRWCHPEQGLVYPDQFIPYAEKSGLISAIDQQVLRKACCQAVNWLNNGYSFEQISVNISGVELRDGYVDIVLAILDESQLPPEKLKLEVTETFLMTRLNRPIEILGKLKSLGINIAIDDFGAGYSSLTRLKRLPVCCLKIDRSFIREIHLDETDQSIVEAIVSLSKSLQLGVIAEGVENIEQLTLLKKLGAHQAQGYYISRPASADKIDALYQHIKNL